MHTSITVLVYRSIPLSREQHTLRRLHTMAMASRALAVNYWKSVSRSATRCVATAAHADGQAKPKPRMDYVPVYVALGLIALSATLGLNTARHQLAHAPNVLVDKKKRETVPEVAEPDWTLDETRRFLGGSVFRKIAQLQDFDAISAGTCDPTHGLASENMPMKAETLKDVGVEVPGTDQAGAGGIRGLVDRLFKTN